MTTCLVLFTIALAMVAGYLMVSADHKYDDFRGKMRFALGAVIAAVDAGIIIGYSLYGLME